MGTPQLMTWHDNKPSTTIVGRDNGAAGNDLGRTYR